MTVAVVDVFTALLVIGLFLVAAKWLRARIPLFRRLFLPASVIGGALALLVGPQVLGRLVDAVGGPTWLEGGLLPDAVLEVWAELPVLLISVVFAALFIGKHIPGIRQIWEVAGPQVALGQSIAWGQYVVGLLLGLLVLGPVFGLPPVAGALIEIGFEGGHGTAAGLSSTFEEFGFAEGTDLALGLATIGLLAGVLIGTVIVNWGVRTGRIALDQRGDPVDAARASTEDDLDDLDDREGARRQDDGTTSTDPMSIHLGFVAVAIAIGWLLLRALEALEVATWGGEDGLELLVHLPLFPMAMLGGVLLQLLLDRTGRAELVERHLVNRISGTALDLIIVAALGTLSLEAIGGNLGPFVLLAVAGIVWNVAAFLLLAPRIVPEYAYERGLGDFGQSMGMTVTGLLLMRIADPPNRSGGLEAFGYKQLLFEPVVGGGLFTAASVPLIAQVGAVPVLIGTSVLLVFWVVLGLRRFGPAEPAGPAS
ncbi:MAG: sodium/glutamate symporter [Nitriliruptoraceae bacterium]